MRLTLKSFSLCAIGLVTLGQLVIADEFTDKYGSITDHNIFLKERVRPRPPTSRSTTRNSRTYSNDDPETKIFLRGVVIEDNELRAYFENTRTNKIEKVVPGDPIGKGHVAEIAIDAVQYALDGRLEWVSIGHNLAGVTPTGRGGNINRGQIPSLKPTSPTQPNGDMTGDQTPEEGDAEADTENAGDGETHADQAQPPQPADMSSLSVEERLKLRRQMEKSGAK